MKVRFQVERVLEFTDFVEMEVDGIEDESKDSEVLEIVSNRDIRKQAFDDEKLEIIDVVEVKDEEEI